MSQTLRGETRQPLSPKISKPVFKNLSRSIFEVTKDSPEAEKQICQRMAKASYDCKGYAKLGLRKGKWERNGEPLQVFLLIDREEVASYIVMGQQQGKEVAFEMFTLEDKRRQGNMQFLLFNVFKSMSDRLDTIWFEVPMSECECNFLESVSQVTGLKFGIFWHSYFFSS